MYNNKVKIVVWLKQDYSESDEFELVNVSPNITKKEITAEVNKRYKVWYYYDIL